MRSLILICSFLVVFGWSVGDSFARSPYDPYDAPVDSVVNWFYDQCNQNQQARAFWHVVEYKYWDEKPYSMVELKSEYDLQVIKDAYEFFVRSLSVDNQSGSCSQFFPDAWFGRAGDNTKSSAWRDEGFTALSLVMSLYMQLGYTTDLYNIADSLAYFGQTRTWYWAYLWNKLGSGYFQHLKSKVQANPSNIKGIQIAGYYLKEFNNPIETIRDAALDVISSGASSTSIHQRYWTAQYLVDVYLAGYSTVKDDIDNLALDSDENVKTTMRSMIRTKQEYKHQMMNFLQDDE